jgi:hypothetical protein
LNEAGAPDSAEKTAIVNDIAAVRALLVNGNVDDAGKKLPGIAQAIETLRGRIPRAGRPDLQKAAPRLHAVLQPPPQAKASLTVLGAPAERSTDVPIRFKIDDPASQLQAGDKFRWYLGDGSTAITDVPETRHRYSADDNYTVLVEVVRGAPGAVVRDLSAALTVLAGRNERRRAGILKQIQFADVLFTVVALFLACLTGLLYLYVGKTFGTLSDYILAVLWGFGIDSSVRGFAAVTKKIGSSGT